MRAHKLDTSRLRRVIFVETLARLVQVREYSELALDDSYQSLMLLGPPGVGKSTVIALAARDVAETLSELYGERVEVRKVSLRASIEEAARVAEEVAKGKAIPYVHIYLPQTKIWHLEGTPSPQDNYATVAGRRLPVNLWRVDAYILPLLDIWLRRDKPLPAFLALDEFNMARKEVYDALFQLARSAELGRAKLNPATMIALIGNTPETNIEVSRDLAAPLVDRSQVYIVTEPAVDSWIAYMEEVYGDKWGREVAAFLARNPDKLMVRLSETELCTPRSWTHLATRIYALKKLYEMGVIADKEEFQKHVARLAWATLPEGVAAEFIQFLQELKVVSLEAVVNDPSVLASLDPATTAYALVKLAGWARTEYKRRPGEVVKVLSEAVKYASRRLGVEAVSLVVNSLPINITMRLAKSLPGEVKAVVREARKAVKELAEVLGA